MDTQLTGLNFSNLLRPAYDQFNKANELSESSKSPQDLHNNTENLLKDTLLNKFGSVSAVNDVKANDFSPQTVADRIINFVGDSIALQSGNPEQAQLMLKEAREGVKQGISEAREILQSMARLNAEVDSTINETEQLIFKGLDNLAASLNGESSAPQISDQAQLISSAGSISSQFKQSSEASIEIVTQDGDRVEVSYSAFFQQSSNQQFVQNQQASSTAYEYTAQSSVAFQFSVQGELDQAEQQAISSLLNDVGNLAEKFFNGDVQAAFNSSLELGFDSQQLQSFALDFQQSTYVEVVQTYQQTQQLDTPLATETNQDIGPGPAVDVLAQLEQLLESSKQKELVAEPENTIKSLLVDMLDLLNQGNSSPLNRYIKDIIESV